jgi:hypothetical protein
MIIILSQAEFIGDKMSEEDLKPQNIVATKKAISQRFFVSIDVYIILSVVAVIVTLALI